MGLVAAGDHEDAPTGDAPALESPLAVGPWHVAGFPIVSYGSDIGLDLGAALFLYRPSADRSVDRDKLALSVSYATRGPRQADGDATVRRFLGAPLRLRANIHVADNPLMPYWGEGAQLGGLPTPAGFATPPPPYRYRDRRAFGALAVRGAIAGPFGWHVRARWLGVEVREPSALLAASSPPGVHGGNVALGEVGLLLDTRDREVATRRGVFASIAAFEAPRLGAVSQFAFHGYDAALRLYVPLWSGATLAVRGLYDVKAAGAPGPGGDGGAVPFFERMLYEGLRFDEGLGGAATVRGIARFRLAGDEKELLNVQLRAHVLTTHLLGSAEAWGVGLGFDAGRARQRGYPAVRGKGVAIGLRMVWDGSVLARVDVARAPGGEDTVYVAFGEMF
jgi:hypothetical protein